MHNIKRLLLISACCISMAFPATALASEVTEPAAPVIEVMEDEAIVADSVTSDENSTENVTGENGETPETDQETDVVEGTEGTDGTDEGSGDESGEELYTGLKEEDGKLYYYQDGEMVTDAVIKAEDDYWYFFQKDGSAYTTTGTLVKAPNGKTYTFRSNGRAYAEVVKKVEGNFYYFCADAYQYSNVGEVRKVGNYYYTFNENGTIMINAPAVKVGKYYYYFGPTGKAVCNKVKKINGYKYYFMGTGHACTTWKYVGDDLYCFGSNGRALKGFQKKGNQWCYIDKSTCIVKFRSNALYTAYKKIKSSYSSTQYYMTVDTKNNYCIIFKGSANNWVPYKVWRCSPGKASTPTVKGHFRTGGKGYSFGGKDYTCYYYTQIHGDYLFHSVLYRKNSNVIKDGRLGKNLSHGCVRLDIKNAKWIYDNIPYGTQIYIW